MRFPRIHEDQAFQKMKLGNEKEACVRRELAVLAIRAWVAFELVS